MTFIYSFGTFCGNFLRNWTIIFMFLLIQKLFLIFKMTPNPCNTSFFSNKTDLFSEPVPVRDGRYVVRGHVVEVKDGKQMPHGALQATQLAQQKTRLELEAWKNEMPGKYDYENRYNDYSNGLANGGILYAMNEFRDDGKLYSAQPTFDPYGTPGNRGGYGTDGQIGERTENGPVSDALTMAEQEKLRTDAIAKSGPKLAFINDESHKEPPEGALPCIMGRDSPGGSVTSLDSLDELPSKGQDSVAFSRSGIIAKGGRDAIKSAGKRRVTFSDSIEFDDGVTGQLVTEEKQSTKVYTMLYARNVNNYYNMPSTSSASLSGHSGASQKGNKYALVTSVAQTGTEQSNTSTAYSAVKSVGKESSVVTVVHSDQPKPKPVALGSNYPTKPEKIQFSSRQEDLSKEVPLRLENFDKDTEKVKNGSDVVSDQELNDSLEVIRDSLDEKDEYVASALVTQKDDEEYKESSAVTWTIGSSSLRDSLDRYVKSTAETTAEELIDEVASSDGRVGERSTGFVSGPIGETTEGFASDSIGEMKTGFVSHPQEERESAYPKAGHMAHPSRVTSGYQFYQPLHTYAAPAMVTSPHFYHNSGHVYSGLHVSGQEAFHQNFPYPFYTSAGLVGMSPASQEQLGLERAPIPYASKLTATDFRVEGREVVQSIDPQISPVQGAVSAPSAGHAVNSEPTCTGATGPKEAGTLRAEIKTGTNNKPVTSRHKHSSSPTSTASTTSSNTRSPRSLIPRPPATRKSGRGRVHPGSHFRKQITARPRKAVYNHPAASHGGQSVKSNRLGTQNNEKNQAERAVVRQNSPSTRSGNSQDGRAHSKRPNDSKADNTDHDGIIEGIKRNMEMMNMRARTTAAEEQHQRLLDSLRLEFGDGKREKLSQQASLVYGGSHRAEDNMSDKNAMKQDAATRRVHHPRVGSAGSRVGRLPAGGGVRMVPVDENSYQATGFQEMRPSAGDNMRIDPGNNEKYQTIRSQGSRPLSGISSRLESTGEDSYQPAASQQDRPVGGSVRMDFANDNYHPGFVQTVLGDEVKGIVEGNSGPGMNQRHFFEERRHDFPTSTVGHSTSAATTRQEREGPIQARGITLHEREESDVKRSISLDKTPTDDEINHLWAHVRSYLHGGNTKSVGSDSCVNRVDVRRSRTRTSSSQQALVQRTAPQQNARGSQLNGQQFLEVPPQGGGSTLGGLRRYGSHEVLRRNSSSDSLSFKRSPLLQHRASRNRRPQGPTGRPPLPRQSECKPSPSQAGPSASVSTRGNIFPIRGDVFPFMASISVLTQHSVHCWECGTEEESDDSM